MTEPMDIVSTGAALWSENIRLKSENKQLRFQNQNLLEFNARERSYNASWAEKWNSACGERDLFKRRWEHSEELRTALVQQLHKALAVGEQA